MRHDHESLSNQARVQYCHRGFLGFFLSSLTEACGSILGTISIFLLTNVLLVDQLRNTGFTVVDQISTKRGVDHSYSYRQCASTLYQHRIDVDVQKYFDLYSHWNKPCRHPLSWGGGILVLIGESHCFNRTHTFWDFGGCWCESKTSNYWLHQLSAALWPIWVIFGG